MSKIVTLNMDIVKAFRVNGVNIHSGRLYLLGLYFGIDTSCINAKVKEQVNKLGIFTPTSYDKVIWKIPLFNEENESSFNWISDWMDGFGKINPNRRGTKASVMLRMKRFFSQHPEIRADDVFKATELYFKTVSDPTYLKSSHKFIFDGAGFNLSSMLLQYVEQLKATGITDGRSSKMK